MQEGQAGSGHDCSPERHVGRGVLVEEGEPLAVDVQDSEVEEDPAPRDFVKLRKSDARAETSLLQLVDDVLLEPEGGKESVDKDSFVDSVSVLGGYVEAVAAADGVADDSREQSPEDVKEALRHFSEAVEGLLGFLGVVELLFVKLADELVAELFSDLQGIVN